MPLKEHEIFLNRVRQTIGEVVVETHEVFNSKKSELSNVVLPRASILSFHKKKLKLFIRI